MSASDLPAADGEGDESDRKNLLAAAGGDRAAFDRLYRRYQPRLMRFLSCRTSHRDLIDDIVNDAMLIVWRSAADYRGESKVSTWMIGIAYRCMLKHLRQIGSEHEVGESALDGLASALAPADTGFERRRVVSDWVDHGLRRLSPEQRMTVELAYFMGESCESIAVIMDCAVGTVKARMFHARALLRDVLPGLGRLDGRTIDGAETRIPGAEA